MRDRVGCLFFFSQINSGKAWNWNIAKSIMIFFLTYQHISVLFRDACFHFQSQGCKRGGHSEEAGRALKGSISRSGRTEGDRSRFEERSFLYSPVKPRTLRSQLGSMETRGRKTDLPSFQTENSCIRLTEIKTSLEGQVPLGECVM